MARLPHDMLTFSGVIGPTTVPIEQWSWSLRGSGEWDTNNTADEIKAFAALARGAWVTHLAPVQPTTVHLTRVRASVVDELGRVRKLPDGAYMQGDDDGDWPGAVSNTSLFPLQTALVVSLGTARAGTAGKGRTFLPWPGYALGTDWRLSEANAANVRDSFKNFLNALRATTGGDPGMMNFVPTVESTKGYSSVITHVRVGRVPDTLRSRRRSQLEGYLRADL